MTILPLIPYHPPGPLDLHPTHGTRDSRSRSATTRNHTAISGRLTSHDTMLRTSSSADKQDALPAELKIAIRMAREAETLHAYDVGVCAALKSMSHYWSSRVAQCHVSNGEKRIFRREAQRLSELVGGAEREVVASNARLMKRQDEEGRLWGSVSLPGSGISQKDGKSEEEEPDTETNKLTNSTSQLNLEGALMIEDTKNGVKVLEVEKEVVEDGETRHRPRGRL